MLFLIYQGLLSSPDLGKVHVAAILAFSYSDFCAKCLMGEWMLQKQTLLLKSLCMAQVTVLALPVSILTWVICDLGTLKLRRKDGTFLCYFTIQDAPKISSQLSSALLLWLRVWWKGHSSHHREQFSPFQHLQEQTQALGECRHFRLWCWSPIQDAQGCRKCGDRRWSPLSMVGPDSGKRYLPGLWRSLNTDYN